MSLRCVVDDKAQSDQHPWTHHSEEPQHRPLYQHMAAQAGLRQSGTLLGRSSLNGEAIMLDDVTVVGERGLDNDLVLDLAVQTKAWVPLVVQGVSEVTLQVYTVQIVRWGGKTQQVRCSVWTVVIFNFIKYINIQQLYCNTLQWKYGQIQGKVIIKKLFINCNFYVFHTLKLQTYLS